MNMTSIIQPSIRQAGIVVQRLRKVYGQGDTAVEALNVEQPSSA